jgi:hypothetical protein
MTEPKKNEPSEIVPVVRRDAMAAACEAGESDPPKIRSMSPKRSGFAEKNPKSLDPHLSTDA